MCDRQAGVEIEITPEMIEAGVEKLLGFYSDEIFDSADVVVAEAYKAMALVVPQSRS